ncbi:hypothetical protein [Rhodococcus erythropolis]|uniref:hypothetical protein n=1 Tax=Rhodococcus erythropolis TaxID=1833 RepID=UPI003672A4A5
MTSPDRLVPTKSYTKTTVSQMQNVDISAYKQAQNADMQHQAESVRGNLLGNLLGGFANVPAAVSNAPEIRDLQDATQKLEGIIGYGSYVASQNLFLSIDQDVAGARVQSFDRQVGPSVGVTMVKDPALANKIVQRMDSKGLWQVLAQTRAQNTGFTGSEKVYQDIVVKAPNGTEYYRRSLDENEGSDGKISMLGNVFFTIPAAGYMVHIELFSGKWRWFYGGSQWTGLSLLKHSSEVENPGTVDPGTPPVA